LQLAEWFRSVSCSHSLIVAIISSQPDRRTQHAERQAAGGLRGKESARKIPKKRKLGAGELVETKKAHQNHVCFKPKPLLQQRQLKVERAHSTNNARKLSCRG
jgi:hypothetical protein